MPFDAATRHSHFEDLYFQGVPHREIAAELNLTPQQLHRAIRQIHTRLRRRADHDRLFATMRSIEVHRRLQTLLWQVLHDLRDEPRPDARAIGPIARTVADVQKSIDALCSRLHDEITETEPPPTVRDMLLATPPDDLERAATALGEAAPSGLLTTPWDDASPPPGDGDGDDDGDGHAGDDDDDRG
jgi:hypothetical protein